MVSGEDFVEVVRGRVTYLVYFLGEMSGERPSTFRNREKTQKRGAMKVITHYLHRKDNTLGLWRSDWTYFQIL